MSIDDGVSNPLHGVESYPPAPAPLSIWRGIHYMELKVNGTGWTAWGVDLVNPLHGVES